MKYLLLLLLILSCKKALTPLPPVQTPITPKPPEVATSAIKLELVSLNGFNEAQAARFKLVMSKVEKVLSSPEFKEAVLTHTHNGKGTFFDTTESNQKVYDTMVTNPWKVEYVLKYRRISTSTIGYTYPNVSWVAIYADKFRAMKDCEVAANIAHEYSHKLGYKHTMKWTKDRPYSVPYGVGSIVERLCEAL